jgi:hypothetical protein
MHHFDPFSFVLAFFFVSGLMVVGSWLETINGKHGFIDEFLTPLPLGIVGMIICFERAWT